MQKCAFCPVEAETLSGEHIWDDWLNRALPTQRFRVRQKRSLADPFREYDARKIKEKLRVVCETCNNGWMSDVTNEVKQAFSETIVRGAPISVLPTGAALLAAFAFMKSVVADHATGQDDPFFTRAARDRLRASLAVPSDLQIWIAAYQGTQRYSGKFVAGIYSPPGTTGVLDGIEFFTLTYVVGRLVLQTLAPRWKHILHRARPLPILNPNTYWNPAAILLWPSCGSSVPWPPEKYLGDDTIQAYIDRFGVPINIG